MKCKQCGKDIPELNVIGSGIISGLPPNYIYGGLSMTLPKTSNVKSIFCSISNNGKDYVGTFCDWRCFITWIDEITPVLVDAEIEDAICNSHS